MEDLGAGQLDSDPLPVGEAGHTSSSAEARRGACYGPSESAAAPSSAADGGNAAAHAGRRCDYWHLGGGTPNPRWVGQPYCFAYGLCTTGGPGEAPGNNCTAVCKLAVNTGTTLTWHEEGLLPRRVAGLRYVS